MKVVSFNAVRQLVNIPFDMTFIYAAYKLIFLMFFFFFVILSNLRVRKVTNWSIVKVHNDTIEHFASREC